MLIRIPCPHCGREVNAPNDKWIPWHNKPDGTACKESRYNHPSRRAARTREANRWKEAAPVQDALLEDYLAQVDDVNGLTKEVNRLQDANKELQERIDRQAKLIYKLKNANNDLSRELRTKQTVMESKGYIITTITTPVDRLPPPPVV